jgi:hypothetical protein
MLAALIEGPDVDRIAALAGFDRRDVEEVAVRMRASRLWTESGLDYGSWSRNFECSSKQEGRDFVMDMLVAEGVALRTQRKRGGLYVYESLVWGGMKPQ